MKAPLSWLNVVGGGCFINLAVTGLLVGLFAAIFSFTIDAIIFPFLIGATASFGTSLYLLRQSGGELTVLRKVVLAAAGVVLGSVVAVLGIAGFLLMTGG